MKTIITKVENNRVAKFLEVNDENAIKLLTETLINYPDAFIYDGEYTPNLWVDNGVVSIKNILETPEKTTKRLETYLDKYIDEQAQEFRYESIRTMVTYVGDPNVQFNAEGVGALTFRSTCYTLALMIINEVKQGRPIPTEEELISEMPKLAEFVIYES